MVCWFPVKIFPDSDGPFTLHVRDHRRHSYTDGLLTDGRPPPRYRPGLSRPRYVQRYYLEEEAYHADFEVEERSPACHNHHRLRSSRRPRLLTGTVPTPPPFYNIPPPDPPLPLPLPAPLARLPRAAGPQPPRPRCRCGGIAAPPDDDSSSSSDDMRPLAPDAPPPPLPPLPGSSTIAEAGSSRDTRSVAAGAFYRGRTPGLSSYTGSGSSYSSRRRHRHRSSRRHDRE